MSDFDQRNHDFCKGISDAQFAYIEAERRVKDLKTENAELREFLTDLAGHIKHGDGHGADLGWVIDRMRELGIEVE